MSIDTVNDLPPRVQYIATASQTVFPYPFPIFQDADLVVEVNGAIQTLTTHYTVSGEGEDTGGNVTFVAGQTVGALVTIYRATVIERDSDFQLNGPMFSTSVNDELDKLTLIAQEQRAATLRCLRIPTGAEVDDADIELSPVSNWAGKYLVFDADGKPEPADLVSSGTITQSIIGALIYPQSATESGSAIVPADTRYPWGVFDRYSPSISYANLRTAAYVDGVINMGRDSLFNGVNVGQGRNTGNARGTAVGNGALQSTGAGEDNSAFGYQAMAVCSGLRNTAVGSRSMVVATSAYQNTAVGNESLKSITVGSRSVAVGESALFSLVDFAECTAVGAAALYSCNSHKNTAVGREAGYYISSGEHNVVIGYDAGINQTTGDNNTFVGTFAGQGQQTAGVGSSTSENCVAVGHSAMAQTTTSVDCVAVGVNSLTAVTTGHSSVAIGKNALAAMTTGSTNVAVGRNAADAITTGEENTAVGDNSLGAAAGTTGNTAMGKDTLSAAVTGNLNTAVGHSALSALNGLSNCTGLGNAAAVTGSNQVQLGNSSTTTYAYGAVQDRSDERDKADVRDTVLGLEFILALRPVDFRWDYREDYDWGEKDGSKKRQRFHHGLTAQGVKAAMDRLGVDFGGYQDHSLSGGKDVLTLGKEELIGPLIKAVHELAARVAELEAQTK